MMLSLAGCDAAREVTTPADSYSVSALAVAYEGEGVQAPQMPTRLIRSATVSIEVADVAETVNAARSGAERAGGLVADAEISTRSGSRSASLLLRIPSDSLDNLLERLSALGEVQSTRVSARDVSREYFDTEIRLSVKEATVRRLTELMQRSGSVEDLAAVERELSRATTELETLKGQIRYFDLQVAQSEVRLQLFESGRVAASATKRITRAFDQALDVFGQSIAALVYVVVFLTPWVPVAAVLWIAGRRIAHFRRERRAETAESSA